MATSKLFIITISNISLGFLVTNCTPISDRIINRNPFLMIETVTNDQIIIWYTQHIYCMTNTQMKRNMADSKKKKKLPHNWLVE